MPDDSVSFTGAGRQRRVRSDRWILVAGAAGAVGRQLAACLVGKGLRVRVLVRSERQLRAFAWRNDVEVVEGDARTPGVCDRALDGVGSAFYLMHGLGAKEPFVDTDIPAVLSFARAASSSGVDQITYLGGPFPGTAGASEYLLSRHLVGEILLAAKTPTLALRTSAIIGPGSVPWDMLRAVCEMLPVIPLPAWADRRLEPIWMGDVVQALAASTGLAGTVNAVYDLPGPQVLTYREMVHTYLKITGLQRRVVTAPWVTPRLTAAVMPLISPFSVRACRRLIAAGPPDLLSSALERAAVLGNGFQPGCRFTEAVRLLTAIGLSEVS